MNRANHAGREAFSLAEVARLTKERRAMRRSITILGDGGWGTAMAIHLCAHGHAVRMWGHDPLYLVEMEASRENEKFFPGFRLAEEIEFEQDLSSALDGADVAAVAIPTQFIRPTLEREENPVSLFADVESVVSLAKGLEANTLRRPTEILGELVGRDDVGALSGPSHAEEVAKDLPASVVVAAPTEARAGALQQAFMTPAFRVYTSTDVIGVELGGALKNVIAVAVGVCEGMGLGDNARAALMTRGLAEMTRLGIALGGRAETFAGLSGMGDLITTCVSPFGRNRAVGMALAKGQSLEEILAGTKTVAEGVSTCAAVLELAGAHEVEVPVSAMLHCILEGELTPDDAVEALMGREPKPEAV